ncbi:hypothetical protein RJT34_05002 [Clitoria ternatea]|uniref:Uncharacterized protein n=1 Tax=Clitoria ternatea TaxID=43366 RepID=A0AAN9PST3_CLITE
MTAARNIINKWVNGMTIDKGIRVRDTDRGMKRSRSSKRRKVSEFEIRSSNQKECGGILFFERKGKLLGIDLGKQESLRWDLKDPSSASPSPQPLPLSCTADTPFPRGMRPFKIDGKTYLAGGFKTRPTRPYHNRVYEFHFDGSRPVLNSAPSLNLPKFPILANLRGTIYALYYWEGPLKRMCIPHPDQYDFLFEQYDPVNKSWTQAPRPPFYVQFFDNLRQGSQGSSLDSRVCPVYRSFVVDDKFFIVYMDPSSSQFLLYCFSSSLKKWQKLPTHRYPVGLGRFRYFWYPSASCSELWLSEYGLSLALEIRYRPFLYDNSYVFFQAIAIIYSQGGNAPGVPREKQLLDEVFSGMFPGFRDPDCSVDATPHFLDLGKMDDQTKRICAVVSAYNCRQTYLFISIFDVQMGDPRPPNLLNVSVVKKLVYKLGDEEEFSKLYTVFVV